MSDDSNIDGPHDRDDVTAAEYVLGTLPAEARASLERRALSEPALARKIADWQARLAPLNEGFGEATPPAGVIEAVEARLFGGSKRAGGWINSLGFWRLTAGFAAAVAIVSFAVLLLGPPVQPPVSGSELVASLEASDSQTRVTALFDPEAGTVRISPVSVVPTEDRDFELWIIEGEGAPVSLGVVSQVTEHSVAVPENLRSLFHEGVTLAITLEPVGGSPTGVATGPLVVAGQIASI
jgi:anti-sigma-K factor RskA